MASRWARTVIKLPPWNGILNLPTSRMSSGSGSPAARELSKRGNLMEGLPMKAYLKDLRQRVLADCDGGMGIRQVAVKYHESES